MMQNGPRRTVLRLLDDKDQAMTVTGAINGFGREDVKPVAVNDLGSVEANAHLLRYDTVHGRFPGEVEVAGNGITLHSRGRSIEARSRDTP